MSAATVSDLQALRDADLFGIIDDFAKDIPLLNRLEKVSVPGTSFKLPWVEAGSAGYRAAYAGVDLVDAGLASRNVELKYIDFSVYTDKQIAEAASVGPEKFMAIEAGRKLAAGLRKVEAQFLLGTAHADSTGSYGFDDLFTTGSYLIDGGVTTGSDTTRAYALNFDECKLLLGNDARLDISEVEPCTLVDTSGKPYEGLKATGGFWCAAAFFGTNAARAIVNIKAASMRDSHCASLIEKFGDGFNPDVFVMNKQSIAGIRNGRTATSPTGAPAPYPEEVFGIPLVNVAIPNDMAVVSVS